MISGLALALFYVATTLEERALAFGKEGPYIGAGEEDALRVDGDEACSLPLLVRAPSGGGDPFTVEGDEGSCTLLSS